MTRPPSSARPGITGARPAITLARPTIILPRSRAQAVPPAPPPPPPPVTSGGFYDGTAVTPVPWPTGMGWTAGAESTIRANIQALYNSSGSGNGPVGGGITHFMQHLPALGAVYPIGDGNLNLTGLNYVITDGQGTDVDEGVYVTVDGLTRWRITATGHTGGATIKGSGNPSATPSHAGSVFFWRLLAGTPSAIDNRFRGLTVEGNSTNYATTSAGNGGEKQHCFCLGGLNGFWADHVIMQKNKGDSVYVTDSHLGNISGYRSQNVRISNSWLRQNGRQGLGLIHFMGLTLEDSLLSDICYGPVDVEPNLNWQTCGNLRVARTTFGDWGWDPDFYGSPLFTTTPSGTPVFTGYIEFIDNVLVGLSKTTGRPAEWNSDVTFTPYTPYDKQALFTMTGNLSTRRKNGPAVYLSRNSGGSIITNNKGFLPVGATNFVGGTAGGPVTQSGNT